MKRQLISQYPNNASLLILGLLLSLVLYGCSDQNPIPAAGELPVDQPTTLPAPTKLPTIAPKDTPVTSTPTFIIEETSTPLIESLCSPLEGVTIEELPEIISNPYDPPLPGWDDGHHGTDFAYYRFKERVGMADHPISAVLPGRVVAVLPDRIPYGYTMIIETSLQQFPEAWQSALDLPEIESVPLDPPSLSCPAMEIPSEWDFEQHSIYSLYAHMIEPAEWEIGDLVQCGDYLGGVGTTGKSVNEHLHLEFRLGPASATFSSMAHYENSVTDEERLNYCHWRVSGFFQLLDPMKILNLANIHP